jgi:hypothetical protein
MTQCPKTACLTSLIMQLQSRRLNCPFTAIDMYCGEDWKNVGNKVLWENDYMKLCVRKWDWKGKYLYKNNYSTVHSKVLQGRFYSSMNTSSGISISRYVTKDESYTFQPFSTVKFKSLESSTTLQLYYYHHMY